jgi:hypothetical protein
MNLSKFSLDNENLNKVEKTKDLGVLFDENYHLNHIVTW